MRTACPRCDYDLSGAPGAWERECQLAGTCSECGLGFAWGDLLNPRLLEENRFFEHARFRRGRAFWVTLKRVWRPVVFWKWVRLEWPLHRWRMLLFVVAAALALHVGGLLIFAALIAVRAPHSPITQFDDWLTDMMEPLLSAGSAVFNVSVWKMLVWGTPRPVRVLDWSPEARPILACAVSAFIPLAFVGLPETVRACRVRPRHLARVCAYSFVALPLVLLAPLIAGVLLNAVWPVQMVGRWRPTIIPPLGSHIDVRWYQLGAILVWQVLWWRAAVKHYLRMPHPWATALATMVIAVLLAFVVVLLIGREWAYFSFLDQLY
jgi:hypothetical protein